MPLRLMLLLCFVPVVALAGCDIPRDPEGTLQRVRGGDLRVGITANPPWTRVEAGLDDPPDGVEVRLMRQFARELDAQIQWRQGSESELFEALERGELDIAIGGLTQSTPFSKAAGLTQPYATIRNKKHVWAIRQGENALMLRVEKFLQPRRSQIPQMLEADPQR